MGDIQPFQDPGGTYIQRWLWCSYMDLQNGPHTSIFNEKRIPLTRFFVGFGTLNKSVMHHTVLKHIIYTLISFSFWSLMIILYPRLASQFQLLNDIFFTIFLFCLSLFILVHWLLGNKKEKRLFVFLYEHHIQLWIQIAPWVQHFTVLFCSICLSTLPGFKIHRTVAGRPTRHSS